MKCLKSLRTPTLKNICERMRFSCKRRFMNCNNSSRNKIKCMRYRIKFINDSFLLLAPEAHEVLLYLRMKPGWKYLVNFIFHELQSQMILWRRVNGERAINRLCFFSETKIYLPEVLHLCFGECNDIQYPRCIREGICTLQVGFNGSWWHLEVLEVPVMVSQGESKAK